MESDQNSKKIFLSRLLLKLNNDGMSGVVTVKDNKRALKIYFKNGHVVYADGIDVDSQLIKEIAAKKKLDDNQLDQLKNIQNKDPQSLGKALIEEKLISQSVWSKFMELKVKQILAAAFQMDSAELGFSKSDLNIQPINFIDYNLIQLLIDTIKSIKDIGHFIKFIPGDDAVFTVSSETEDLKDHIPLSPSEQNVLSLINGQMSVGEIISNSAMEQINVYRILYLLLCFDLIFLVHEEGGKGGPHVNYGEIIELYTDLIKIVEANLQKEVGKESVNIFNECLDELTGRSKELFSNFNLSGDSQQAILDEITKRFKGRDQATEGKLFLQSSLNKLIFLLIMRMKKVLGIGLTEKTLTEMMNILDYVEKYRQDTEMMNYVKGNLRDYLRQIKA